MAARVQLVLACLMLEILHGLVYAAGYDVPPPPLRVFTALCAGKSFRLPPRHLASLRAMADWLLVFAQTSPPHPTQPAPNPAPTFARVPLPAPGTSSRSQARREPGLRPAPSRRVRAGAGHPPPYPPIRPAAAVCVALSQKRTLALTDFLCPFGSCFAMKPLPARSPPAKPRKTGNRSSKSASSNASTGWTPRFRPIRSGQSFSATADPPGPTAPDP